MCIVHTYNTKKNVWIMVITDVDYLISICHLEALKQAWNGGFFHQWLEKTFPSGLCLCRTYPKLHGPSLPGVFFRC